MRMKVDYEITEKGEPEKGSVISQKSLVTLITKIIGSPGKYVRENSWCKQTKFLIVMQYFRKSKRHLPKR
jgi:hypothetical protein